MQCVIIHSRKYACSAAVVKDGLFVQRLAKLLIKMIVENDQRLNDLPETRAVLLKFIPPWAKAAVENAVTGYFLHSNEMELEGFINFRLSKQVKGLRESITHVICGSNYGEA